MKNIKYIAAAFLFSGMVYAQNIDINAMPKPGPTPAINIAKPNSFKLKNGLTVLVVENNKLPRVNIRLTIDRPPVYEGNIVGVGEIMADQLGTGTTKLSKEEFNKKAMAQFGSGWTWLVINPAGELEIFSSSNAECIAMDAAYTPILVCDVWEHAYYIDTRNARAQYLENFWKVVNWTKIEERYTAAETK